MNIVNKSGIPGTNNCIYLPDKTSFNWKGNNTEVRINCKEDAKRIIETNTDFKMFGNRKADSTRDVAFKKRESKYGFELK